MKWASAISEADDTTEAIDEVLRHLEETLDGDPDLLMLFAAPKYLAGHPAAKLCERFPAATLIGCTGGGVIGGGQEIEGRPALSVSAAKLDGADLAAVHLDPTEIPQGSAAWQELTGCDAKQNPSFVLLCDPFGFPVERCLAALDAAYPGAVIVGGISSGGMLPTLNAIFADGEARGRGAALLSITGDVVIDPIIAQGCRPIGEPMLVSSCEGHVIYSLGGHEPMNVIQQLHDSLDARDQALFKNSLFIGVEMKDQVEYQAGDFVIRNIVGADKRSGALALAAEVKQWQVVQLHLRDAESSAVDLNAQLDGYLERCGEHEPLGAALFSCLGRGERLYNRSGHDSELFAAKIGQVPLGGFFCNGEIGPIGGKTYLHGYTSAFGVFRRR